MLLAMSPKQLPVLVALMLHGFASCVITPAIAAISLHLAGHAALGERLGRNARYASIGNGIAAAAMGATGAYFSSRFVFLLTAGLCVPALVALWSIGPGRMPGRRPPAAMDIPGLKRLLADRRLLIFAVCVMLFHLSNAAMLPLAASAVTMRAGHFANLIIAACIVVPQGIVALLSPWVGRAAQKFGRKRLLLLGWGALPLRGLLLAVLPGSWPLIAGQAVSGLSAAVFGVMLPLLAADLTSVRPTSTCAWVSWVLRCISARRSARRCPARSPTRPAWRPPSCPWRHRSGRRRDGLAGHAGDKASRDRTQSVSSGMTHSGFSPRITRWQLSNALRKREY